MTSSKGRIVAMSSDTYRTDNPDHLAYHARNRERGRMSGQLRLRVRYKKYAMPWFDYLIVSKVEMESILEGTGWGSTGILIPMPHTTWQSSTKRSRK